MSVIKVVIPARYGSSRLRGKPLLEINQKPIFWHVFQRCLEAGLSPVDICIATDDQRIYSKAISLDLPVAMTSESHESGTDRIHEVAVKSNWADDVIVLNIQGDEPAIPPRLIKALIRFSLANQHFSITTAVTPITKSCDLNNSNIVKAIISDNGNVLYFTRSASPLSRDNPDDFSLAFRHIGIYAYRVDSLKMFCSYSKSPLEECEKLEQLRALSNGMRIGAFRYNHFLPHGVDTLDDYLLIKKTMEG